LGEEPVILKGLVVDWSLPSKAALQDWLGRETQEGVRVREVVELLPIEVFQELDALRRSFDRRAEDIIVRAYSLKILPLKDLPEFQALIDSTRERLGKLDIMIEEALKSRYTALAAKYYEETADRTPKKVGKVSGRFGVLMMPLRIDPLVWDEYLSEELKAQVEKAEADYKAAKETLDSQLGEVRGELERTRKDLEASKAEVEKATEGVSLPFDVATMRIQRKELESRVKDLQAQERELQRRVERLQRERSDESRSVQASTAWAQERTRETERAISFDVRQLWATTLQELAKKALDALDLEEAKRKRPLETVERHARETLERIWSLQPNSMYARSYELLIAALGKPPVQARTELEGLAS